MVSIAAATGASQGSATPMLAFVEVALVGLVCTAIAIALLVRRWS